MKMNRARCWPPVIALTVFFASGRSTIATPDVGFSLDKVAHFAVFGALATSVIRLPGFRNLLWKGAGAAWLLAAGFGAFDEWRQSFTPGRSVEFADWIADALGAAVAVLLYQAWPGYRKVLECTVIETKKAVDV
jgi:VanZ family protein